MSSSSSRSNLSMVRQVRDLMEKQGLSHLEAMTAIANASSTRTASVLDSLTKLTKATKSLKSSSQAQKARLDWANHDRQLKAGRVQLENQLSQSFSQSMAMNECPEIAALEVLFQEQRHLEWGTIAGEVGTLRATRGRAGKSALFARQAVSTAISRYQQLAAELGEQGKVLEREVAREMAESGCFGLDDGQLDDDDDDGGDDDYGDDNMDEDDNTNGGGDALEEFDGRSGRSSSLASLGAGARVARGILEDRRDGLEGLPEAEREALETALVRLHRNAQLKLASVSAQRDLARASAPVAVAQGDAQVAAKLAREMAGRARDEIVARMAMELPRRPRAALSAALDQAVAARMVSSQRAAVKREWVRARDGLLAEAEERAKQARAAADQELMDGLERVRVELDALLARERLARTRVLHMVEVERKMDEAVRAEAEERARAEREAEAREAQGARAKAEVHEYRAQREQRAREEAERERAAREAEEAELRRAIEATRPRVEERHEMEWAKIAERRLEDEIHRKRQEIKELQRQQLKDKVEANVPRDPARVAQPTASSSAAPAEPAAARPAYASISGYTTDEVLKDQRVRLSLALAERGGLDQTEYGRTIIARGKPATAPRIDNFDENQRAIAARSMAQMQK
jgi:hypothetical protein